MKRILVFALMLMPLITVSACSGEKTPKQLIIGNWASIEPIDISQNGTTLTIKNLRITYNEDHSMTSRKTVSIPSANFSAYYETDSVIESTWLIEDNKISETIIDGDMTTKTTIPNFPNIDEAMLEELKRNGAQWSTIDTLDKTTLVLTNKNSGITITMKRQ